LYICVQINPTTTGEMAHGVKIAPLKSASPRTFESTSSATVSPIRVGIAVYMTAQSTVLRSALRKIGSSRNIRS
jgi:hypothetical protein